MDAMAKERATYFSYNMPFGKVTIASDGDAVTAIALGQRSFAGRHAASALTNACANELLEYFAGKRTIFDVPTHPAGSAFQRQAWQAIARIPYGQTMTYQDVAKMMGTPTAYRSVGSAVKANPIIVLIPAHRVVATRGGLEADAHARMRAAFRELESRHA